MDEQNITTSSKCAGSPWSQEAELHPSESRRGLLLSLRMTYRNTAALALRINIQLELMTMYLKIILRL